MLSLSLRLVSRDCRGRGTETNDTNLTMFRHAESDKDRYRFVEISSADEEKKSTSGKEL